MYIEGQTIHAAHISTYLYLQRRTFDRKFNAFSGMAKPTGGSRPGPGGRADFGRSVNPIQTLSEKFVPVINFSV